jgi:catechol 2,3-dioxygenase-like lactoylglutathione lyase family enzyme
MTPDRVTVRYIVNDVEKAIQFYTTSLDFHVEMHPAPGFASLTRGNLQLMLNQPGAGGAGQSMADGTAPEPGGWNRIQITVDDLQTTYDTLSAHGAEFRNAIVEGRGGKQVLLQDPSGNLIELFEARAGQT